VILSPSSFFAADSNCYPVFYVGSGSYSITEQGLGVAASLGSNTSWKLRFFLPSKLPSGTLKLRLVALSKALTVSAKINPQCEVVAMGSNPGSTALVSQVTSTLTWASGDNDKYKELKITLTGITPVINSVLVMDLFFLTSGWTLAQASCWVPFLIWE
jgi:hypothetical protein